MLETITASTRYGERNIIFTVFGTPSDTWELGLAHQGHHQVKYTWREDRSDAPSFSDPTHRKCDRGRGKGLPDIGGRGRTGLRGDSLGG